MICWETTTSDCAISLETDSALRFVCFEVLGQYWTNTGTCPDIQFPAPIADLREGTRVGSGRYASSKSPGLGYLRSALSSRNFIHFFRNGLPLDTVSESPIIHKCRLGRVIATVMVVSTARPGVMNLTGRGCAYAKVPNNNASLEEAGEFDR